MKKVLSFGSWVFVSDVISGVDLGQGWPICGALHVSDHKKVKSLLLINYSDSIFLACPF